jgi:hypothetical protein
MKAFSLTVAAEAHMPPPDKLIKKSRSSSPRARSTVARR